MPPKNHNTRNPLEQSHDLFKRLTRLFSGPLVSYKAQVEKSLRRKQLDKYSRQLKTTDGQHFKKQQFNLYDALRSAAFMNVQRHQRYNDFNEMDTDAYISSCLDIYSDEMCTYSKLQPMLTINCANEEIKEVLKVLYKDVLNVECNLPGWCRSMCKFGDFFMFLDIDDSLGIQRGIALPPGEVERLEGEDKLNPDYVQFQLNTGGLTLENWQVAHFRILGVDKYAPFGVSVLDGGRRTYRQLCYAKGTKVWLPNLEEKNIEDMKIGDVVFSFDRSINQIIETKVKNVAFMGIQKVIEIKSGEITLKVTPNHGVYVRNKDDQIICKMAKDLICFEDKLICPTELNDCDCGDWSYYSFQLVEEVVDNGEFVETYDLEVDHECHNFTADGVIASNTLLEDSIIAYRIVRAPERKVFYLDVGNIPPQDVEVFMQKAMTQMKRHQIADPTTGRVDLRYQPMSVENDYFLPVRGQGSATRIEPLPGGQFVGDIDDLKYIKDKLFAALKVPISYISRGEGSSEDQGSLSVKDIRFARTIQRLQKSVIAELTKIGLVHLFILGYRNEDLLSFSLALNNPSKIAELQELEHWKTKFEVAGAATENFFSRRWIGERIFNLSEEEMLRNQREMYQDRWLDSQLNSISEGTESSSGGGGGLEGLSSPDNTPDAGLEGTDETGEPSEPPTLLAAPGKRDEPHLTPGSKGKVYFPEEFDKRGMGARSVHMDSLGGTILPGLKKMKSLGRGIANESLTLEESKLHNTSFEIKQLLEKLESKTDKKII